MEKILFETLNLVSNDDVVNYVWQGIEIEIKGYLPFAEKLQVVSNIVNNSYDGNDFYNPMRIELYTALEVVSAYTNLDISKEYLEDAFKLYDTLIGTGLYDSIREVIPMKELSFIWNNVQATIDSVYKYKNSALGILENIKAGYEGMNLDASEIQQKLADPDNMELLKTILTKLG